MVGLGSKILDVPKPKITRSGSPGKFCHNFLVVANHALYPLFGPFWALIFVLPDRLALFATL